jgi:hypothetical protein
MYSALIDQLPRLENQHPQCIGGLAEALFGGVANRPKLSNDRGTYRTEAGQIHGTGHTVRYSCTW